MVPGRARVGRGRVAMSRTGTTLEALKTLGPIPKTMRAGVYREQGIVRVEEVPVPEVAEGELLIRVAACGVCGTDIKKIFYAFVPPPQNPRHELAAGGLTPRRPPAKNEPALSRVG